VGIYDAGMMFASDNWAGAAPEIMTALSAANDGSAAAYGGDDVTAEIERTFQEIFQTDLAVFFVATGTAANALSMASVSKVGGVVFAHEEAHVAVEECGATQFATGGARIHRLPGRQGKLSPQTLSHAMAEYNPDMVHHGQLAAASLTQMTEVGTVYTASEIAALSKVAHDGGLAVHMDGARFANALAASNSAPADLTWRAGVDVMSFGGTKNGCWCAEAVLHFNPDHATDMKYLRMRGGHLFSKSRFVAAQFKGYFADGTWLRLAGQANAMGRKLADGIAASSHARLAWQPDGNEVFAIWPSDLSTRLRDAGAVFHEWPSAGLAEQDMPGDGESLIRLVASFRTTDDDVGRFLAALD